MAHYNNQVRLDGMEVEYVGFAPDTNTAYIDLKRILDTENGETVFIKQELSLPLELLNLATELVNQLAAEVVSAGGTDFELRRPDELEPVS